MADDQTKNVIDAGAAPKKKGKGMILIVIFGLVLIAGGVAAGIMLGVNNEADQKKSKPEPSIILEFKDLYVNVAETKATRVLKLTTVLKLSDQELEQLLRDETPIIRDLISEAASQMTIDQLDGMNGRKQLKSEIQNKVNEMIRDWMAGAVVDVYFPDFLIQ
ncbi:MAG: flagellar basal body-associated FliL family protein [Pontiellaceae bacterium]|nr:flagellar basal body-associated FliL family protein [Pontiellaceae bacterium]